MTAWALKAFRFNTQPPEGGWIRQHMAKGEDWVSTHSRPKAAVLDNRLHGFAYEFQHTAARRRLVCY